MKVSYGLFRDSSVYVYWSNKVGFVWFYQFYETVFSYTYGGGAEMTQKCLILNSCYWKMERSVTLIIEPLLLEYLI